MEDLPREDQTSNYNSPINNSLRQKEKRKPLKDNHKCKNGGVWVLAEPG